MYIAVEGCSHGELDVIYNSLKRIEELHNIKVDLLLCCGDFQSVRNEKDLKCMAVPLKYMHMQDFYRYYSGEKKAPVLTIFVGGNHEALNYLQELPYGGWVAPNIYYLGYAGVIRFGDLRIGGISGIYKGQDYLKGHYERTPYSATSVRSVYHVRNLEVFKLKQLSNDIDIFMSHDWPRGIYNYGNIEEVLRYKKHFEDEIKENTLGSRAAEELIKKLKPNFWFSGHLHVKFSAIMKHEESTNDRQRSTKFLALDKCLPRREFLQILHISSTNSEQNPFLSYDLEWLTILRLTNHLLSTSYKTVYMPGPGASERYIFTPTSEELEKTRLLMGGSLVIPDSFVKTAPSFTDSQKLPDMKLVHMPDPIINPQTTSLCEKLGIIDPITKLLGGDTASSPFNEISDLDTSYSSPFNQSEMNITTDFSLHSTNLDTKEVDLSDEGEFEISRDGETGDFIMEIPLVCKETSSAERTHCDRIPDSSTDVPEFVKRKSLVLSSPKILNEKEFPNKSIKSEEIQSVSSPSSHDFPHLSSSILISSNKSTQDEEESNSRIGSSIDVISDSSLSQDPSNNSIDQHKTKKFKRRNASLYTSLQGDG